MKAVKMGQYVITSRFNINILITLKEIVFHSFTEGKECLGMAPSDGDGTELHGETFLTLISVIL